MCSPWPCSPRWPGDGCTPLVVAPFMAVALAVAWSVPVAAEDETGLWLVGAFLVFAGTAAGSALVSWLARLRR